MKTHLAKRGAKLGFLLSVPLLNSCTFGDPLYADNSFNGALISLALIAMLYVGITMYFRRRKANH